MSARILIVEDEPGIRLVITDLLRAETYLVETATEGSTGLSLATTRKFDLLILDVMLPGADGFQICHEARQRGFDGAILMLTAKGQVDDRVRGLQTGADDYLVKPFNPDELVARVKALLRRVHKENLTPVMKFTFGNVTVDFSRQEFLKDGKPVSLAAKEAELLRFLVNHRGQALSRAQILQQVWSGQQFITERTVDVHIAWLRQKLEDNPVTPRFIITVRGEGYRFNK
ncbi:MAG TPA: response regulator transcription factor [Pseudomonadales bacterium]|nr:response regulator transcription factor [Pseudomonadales bacterium]